MLIANIDKSSKARKQKILRQVKQISQKALSQKKIIGLIHLIYYQTNHRASQYQNDQKSNKKPRQFADKIKFYAGDLDQSSEPQMVGRNEPDREYAKLHQVRMTLRVILKVSLRTKGITLTRI